MDQSNKNDTLTFVGKCIGILNVSIYLVLAVVIGRPAVRQYKCIFPFPFYGCIGIWLALLVMIGASSEVGRGIKSQRANVLIPFLYLSVFFDIGATALLFYSDRTQLIVISVVLGINIVSWCPIFRLYHIYNSEKEAADQAPPSYGESCPLNPSELGTTAVVLLNSTHHNAANFAASAPDYVEANGSGKPPTYDSLANVPGSNPLQSQVETVIGTDMDWKINTGSKETDI